MSQDGNAKQPAGSAGAVGAGGGIPMEDMPELVIVSGMSGAGRTEAMHVFEDLGYFCVDNLPASLIGNLFELGGMSELPGQPAGECRIAVVCDARNRMFFSGLTDELRELDGRGLEYRILFLDASDEKLIARYKSSRRRHPLCEDGTSIEQGIQRERSLLFGLREMAHHVVDTTDMLPQQLRQRIRELFATGQERRGLAVTVYSFGFKHGAPRDADLVMDVRFLPNPYYDPALRPLTGLDAPVREYVAYRAETIEFEKRWHALLDCVMPGYVAEGKQQLAIAVGCTGGQHRSVVLAESTGEYLKARGYRVSVAHRDLKLAERGRAAAGAGAAGAAGAGAAGAAGAGAAGAAADGAASGAAPGTETAGDAGAPAAPAASGPGAAPGPAARAE